VLVGLGLFDPSGAGVRTAKGIFVMRITGAKVAYSGIKQTRRNVTSTHHNGWNFWL
jgi:hypothetical protein